MRIPKPVTAEEIVGNEVVAPSNVAPEDAAAGFFQVTLPDFKKMSADLSKNQLHRVLNAIIEAPLNEKKFIFYDEKEMKAFQTGLKLVDAKFVMFQAAINEKVAKNNEKEIENEAV